MDFRDIEVGKDDSFHVRSGDRDSSSGFCADEIEDYMKNSLVQDFLHSAAPIKETNMLTGDDSESDNDHYDTYVNRLKEIMSENRNYEAEDEQEGNPKKNQGTLPLSQNQSIVLQPFERDFLKLHPIVELLSTEEVTAMRKTAGITLTGFKVPRYTNAFAFLNLPDWIESVLHSQGICEITPIQSQVLPTILSGRDVFFTAPTGSGKTLCFVIPMLIHLNAQERVQKKEGMAALILAPSRELSFQHDSIINQFLRHYPSSSPMRSTCLTSGFNATQQIKRIRAGTDILCANPGRLISIINNKSCNIQALARITYLVLDEADILFNNEFEAQVSSIISNIRSDRQLIATAATSNPFLESLCKSLSTARNFVSVKIEKAPSTEKEELSLDHHRLIQFGVVLQDEEEKREWIMENLAAILAKGRREINGINNQMKMIIFVNERARCLSLQKDISNICSCVCIYGDPMLPTDRKNAMDMFRQENSPFDVMIATDVLSRGIDINNVSLVINYDAPKNVDVYIHRVGRCGRKEGERGVSFTLLLPKDKNIAAFIANDYKKKNMECPLELLELAKTSKEFKTSNGARKPLKKHITLDSIAVERQASLKPTWQNDTAAPQPNKLRVKESLPKGNDHLICRNEKEVPVMGNFLQGGILYMDEHERSKEASNDSVSISGMCRSLSNGKGGENVQGYGVKRSHSQLHSDENDESDRGKKRRINSDSGQIINHSAGKRYAAGDIVSSDDESTYIPPTPFIKKVQNQPVRTWLNSIETIDEIAERARKLLQATIAFNSKKLTWG